MQIDKTFNGRDLATDENIYLLARKEDTEDIKVESSKRINIDYALKEDVEKELRFTELNNKYVSKRVKSPKKIYKKKK